jgi:hypothetical protein
VLLGSFRRRVWGGGGMDMLLLCGRAQVWMCECTWFGGDFLASWWSVKLWRGFGGWGFGVAIADVAAATSTGEAAAFGVYTCTPGLRPDTHLAHCNQQLSSTRLLQMKARPSVNLVTLN